jgi:hypothetical protein
MTEDNFYEWLSAARATVMDFELTVKEVGIIRTIEIMNERIVDDD